MPARKKLSFHNLSLKQRSLRGALIVGDLGCRPEKLLGPHPPNQCGETSFLKQSFYAFKQTSRIIFLKSGGPDPHSPIGSTIGLKAPQKEMIQIFDWLIVLISAGISTGLKCWDCESDMNWDKCKLLKTKECVWPQTRCGKFYTKQGAVETYRRDCFTEEYCNIKPQCTSQFSKCDINCCSGDACNSGMQKTSSYFLCLIMLFGTLVVFIF